MEVCLFLASCGNSGLRCAAHSAMVRARQRTQAILLSIFAATRAGFGDRAAIADELAHQPPLVVPDARDTWAAQFPRKCASASPAATIKGGRGAGKDDAHRGLHS